MQLRKFLLRLMLWSLVVAAVLGAVSILVASKEVVWRVVGTAVATAIASSLMLACSLMADHRKGREAGLLGMAGVLVDFLLGLLLIWDLAGSSNWHVQEHIGITMLMIPCTFLPAMFFLRAAHTAAGRAAAMVGVPVCGAVLLTTVGPLWVWMGSFGSAASNWWATAWSIGAFGIVAAAATAGAGTDRRHWRWIGVAAAAVGLLMTLVAIWKEIHEGSTLFNVICTVAFVIAHANLVMLCSLTPGQQWLRWGTIGATVLTGALLDLLIAEAVPETEMLGRLAGACGFVASCGSLALLVFARLNRRMGERPVLSEIRELTLTCPGCQRKQTLSVGQTHCPSCRLRFDIRIEEPHCAKCDYLLYMLAADRCPECGEAIA